MRKAVILLAALLAVACERPTSVPPAPPPVAPPPAQPGSLVVAWGSASQSYAAAIIIEIRGGRMGSISNPDPRLYLLAEESPDSTSARIVLAGQIYTQDLAVFEVPDVRAITSYQPTLISAVGPDGELYGLEGYALRIYKRGP